MTRGQLPQRAGSLGLNGGGTAAAVPPPAGRTMRFVITTRARSFDGASCVHQCGLSLSVVQTNNFIKPLKRHHSQHVLTTHTTAQQQGSKGKGRTLDIAPQVDIATTKALRYMARTKQRRTYLPYTFPAIAGTHLPTREDGGLSKPRPRVQRATGPRLLHDSPQPTESNHRHHEYYS